MPNEPSVNEQQYTVHVVYSGSDERQLPTVWGPLRESKAEELLLTLASRADVKKVSMQSA